MDFKLIERPENELIHLRRNNLKACPLVIEFMDGERVDVWDLNEEEVLDLVELNVVNAGSKLTFSEEDLNKAFKVLKCWKEKHKTVSSNFVKEYYKLKEKYKHNPKQHEYVRDMLNPIVFETVDLASKIAKFNKGKNNDFTAVTQTDVLDIMIEQERQLKAQAGIETE